MARETKYSGSECFGFVPAPWRITRLKSILMPTGEKNTGDRDLLSVYLDKGVISYSESTGMQVHKPSDDLSNYQNVEIGDFVLNNQQAWRGSVGVSKHCGIISPAYLIYKFTEEVDMTFMNYLLRDCSMVQQYEISSRGVGTIQRNIYAPWLMNATIVLPSVNEQRRIAEFLEHKCDEIDSVVADTQQTIEGYKKLKQSIITEAVIKGIRGTRRMKESGIEWIGKIPEEWDIKKGKWILTLLDQPVYEDDGVITCFRDGEVTLRSNRREDGFTISFQETGYQGINVGDLVVHGMDGFAGAIGISDSRGKGTPVLNVLDSTQNKRYVMYYLRSMAHNGVFLALSTGIRVRSCDTNWNKLKELPYPIPSIDEQEEIARYIDGKMRKIDTLIAQKQAFLTELEKYKKSVIHEYVTGKKEVPACQ